MSADTLSFSFESDDASESTTTTSSAESESAAVAASPPSSGDSFAFDLGDFEVSSTTSSDPDESGDVEPVIDMGSWMDDDDLQNELSDAGAAGNASEDAVHPDGPEDDVSANGIAPDAEIAPDEETFDFGALDFPSLTGAVANEPLAEPTTEVADGSADEETSLAEEFEADDAEGLFEDEVVVTSSVSAAFAAPAEPGSRPRLLNHLGQAVARPRVAVLGASGIGRNHARWFVRYGCELVSFLGSSDESVEATRRQLSESLPFKGEAFTDLETLLRESKPDIVCVATPAPLHFAHTLAALEADCHVLCEKPLVYAPSRSPRENRDGAHELVRVARQRGKVLGTQLQYAAATPILCKLANTVPTEVSDCAMEIESVNPNSPRSPRDLWLDLGPHPLSVVQYLGGPDATLEEGMTQFAAREEGDFAEVVIRFAVRCGDGRLITARAVVRRFNGEAEGRKPRRRIALNGRVVTYSGFTGVDGVYKAEFAAPDGYVSHYRDPVDFLIGNFVAACAGREPLLIDGDFGARNLDWLLTLAH